MPSPPHPRLRNRHSLARAVSNGVSPPDYVARKLWTATPCDSLECRHVIPTSESPTIWKVEIGPPSDAAQELTLSLVGVYSCGLGLGFVPVLGRRVQPPRRKTNRSVARLAPREPIAKARGMQHRRTRPSLWPAVGRARVRGSRFPGTQFGPMPHGSAHVLQSGRQRLRRAPRTRSEILVPA